MSLLGVVDCLAVHGDSAGPAAGVVQRLQRDVRRWLWESRWRPGERGLRRRCQPGALVGGGVGEWPPASGIPDPGGGRTAFQLLSYPRTVFEAPSIIGNGETLFFFLELSTARRSPRASVTPAIR